MNGKINLRGISLETERLLLSPFREADLQGLFDYASQKGVGEMAGWRAHRSIDDSRQVLNYFIRTEKTFALRYEGKLIGSLGIDNYDGALFPELQCLRGRELGFVLSRDYWGRGLMSEAVASVRDWLFRENLLDFILCGNFTENTASRRVQEKCGFRYLKNALVPDWSGRLRETEFSIIYKKDFSD